MIGIKTATLAKWYRAVALVALRSDRSSERSGMLGRRVLRDDGVEHVLAAGRSSTGLTHPSCAN